MTIISYSDVFQWSTCHRAYYYGYVLRKTPTELNESMQVGIKGHKLLQDFYRLMAEGKSKDESREIMTKLAMKTVHEESFTAQKALLLSWTLVDNYIRETEFTAEAIIIENRFLLPAASLTDDPAVADTQIGFTPDVVFKRTGDFIDVEDAKFVGRAWSQSKINRFPQTKLYQIFLSRMGYVVSRNQIRFFNTKTAKTSTKAYTLGKEEENILIYDFFEAVKGVLRYKEQPIEIQKRAPRTMNYTICQYCFFEFPCSLEAEGKDASRTLNSQFKERDYDYTR